MRFPRSSPLLLAALVAVAADAPAQSGTRSRSALPEYREPPAERPAQQRFVVGDPIAALERELPSLRLDLQLTEAQGALWDSFEREARDIAEMGRQRLKRPLQPLEASEAAPPAPAIIGRWSDEDRSRSEAMADLGRKLEALYGSLTESQRREFDRRVYLSQTDPLGPSAGASSTAGRRPRTPR
jgi:hypothetical protein